MAESSIVKATKGGVREAILETDLHLGKGLGAIHRFT